MPRKGRVVAKVGKVRSGSGHRRIVAKEGDVLAVFRRVDKEEIDVEQASAILESERKSRTNRIERFLDALLG